MVFSMSVAVGRSMAVTFPWVLALHARSTPSAEKHTRARTISFPPSSLSTQTQVSRTSVHRSLY